MLRLSLRNQPLTFYCALITVGVTLLVILTILITKMLGWDGGGDDLDHTTMLEAWMGILSTLTVLISVPTGIISGIYRLVKPRGYSRKLIALFAFAPPLIVVLLLAV